MGRKIFSDCKLCGEYKQMAKSHIIPQFMYRGLFKEEENKKQISLVDLNNIKQMKLLQSGIWDKKMLCKSCEHFLNDNFENYSCKVLYGGKVSDEKIVPKFQNGLSKDGIKSVEVSNVDYQSFKLFVLSILWRAHHCHHKLFKMVDIGKHEEVIRSMLLTKDAKEESQYPFYIMVASESKEVPTKLTAQPRIIEGEGFLSVVFLINGMFYNISLEGADQNPMFERGMISANNSISIPILEPPLLQKYFDTFFGKPLRY